MLRISQSFCDVSLCYKRGVEFETTTMSDPLSVAAGVIGIVTAAAQISSLLVKFTVKFKDAPRQASTVLTEVNDTSRILTQLEPFLLGLETPDQSRACHLHVESVIATLTGCVATFSELQQIVDSLELEDMQPNDRLKWSRNERAIATLLAKLKTHKDSLSLMLNVLNWYVTPCTHRRQEVSNVL